MRGPVNVLLSYPRSGNTWIRYFVEEVSGNPTGQATITDSLSNKPKNNAILHKGSKKPMILLKRHRFDNPWDNWDEKKDTIIVLVRNYRESIIRNALEQREKSGMRQCNSPEYHKRAVGKYMHVLDVYNSWSGNKMMLYYEDMILKPFVSFSKIKDFLGLNEEKTKNFCSNYNYHKNNSTKQYKYGSVTSGQKDKLNFHSNNCKKAAADIEKIVLMYPDELLKYIERYKR